MLRPKKWIILPAAPAGFIASVPEHPLLAQVLYNRGLRTAAEVSTFLQGDTAVLSNPYRLRDMVPAVQRIVQAIRRGETICVYGDFDVDGVTATALLVSALQAAGARVGPYIPDRVDEGYGLNLDAIDRLARQVQLLITVDCGIRSVAEVQHACALGLDVIVTDHHAVGATLPPALAVINPRRPDCPSRFDGLAGVGVAYRLAQAVVRAMAQEEAGRLAPDAAPEIEAGLLDLVALGTVADVMPLLGENRALVQRGMALMNTAPRPGVEALMLQSGLQRGGVDATAISFRLAPRLNAAGRLAHAKLAYQILRATDPAQAYLHAGTLEELNQRRRSLTDAAQAEAEEQLAAQLAGDPPIYFVGSEHFEHGIVGLVAGKLTERLYRPTLVMRAESEFTRGSARSIPQFNISRALDEVDALLVRHGGHQLAAGFTLRTEHVPEFQAALYALARRELDGRDDLQPAIEIDAEIGLDDISWGVVEQFARLEPTGEKNPPPHLLARSCRVRSVRTVGEGKHLKLTLDSHPGGVVFDAIGFHLAEWRAHLDEGSRIDVVFLVEINEWQGTRRLQLNVQDLRGSE